MATDFEFQLPNGDTVKTGNIAPDVKPLGSFQQYPDADLLNDDQIRMILQDPGRKRARDIYGADWLLNQGGANSCNLYACAGALARARDRKGLGRVEFSPEWGYMNINGGRDQGSHLDKGMLWMTERGLPLKGMVPYESFSIQRHMSNMEDQRRAAMSAADHRYFEAYVLPANEGIEKLWRAMVSALLRNEQIVIAVHVGQQYMYTPNKPWTVAGFDPGRGNHAVACDDVIAPKGWSQVTDLLPDQYGSWSVNHGENGRCLLLPRHVEEPSKYHCYYAVRSATSSKSDKCPSLRA